MTIDLDAMKINKAKFMADGNKYFELYRKHIPGNISGNILLLSIGNLDCISKIMSMNPNAKYLIIDRKTIIKSLSIVCKDIYDIEAIENDDEDLYNIIQELDMKFDCIIMNPPYQRGLHLKILKEAINHLVYNGKIISLQPIVKWQEAELFNTNYPVNNTCICDRYAMHDCSKLFGSHQRCDLGIVSNGKISCKIIDNVDTLNKIQKKLKYAINIAGLLKDKLEREYNDFPINFGDGVTIAGNCGHGKACYRIVGMNEMNATRREQIGHTIRYNAKDSNEQHLIYKFYSNQLIRFIAKEFGFGGIPYKIIPFITGFIDENGNTPLDEEWTFEKLVNWFNLDYSDLLVIRQSLDTYLHDDEQKIIEETMAKYK